MSRSLRLRVLEETNSFLAAVTTEPLTVGKEWVQTTGLMAALQNYQPVLPDLAVNENGETVSVRRNGRYFGQVNFHLTDPTSDGYFEPAIEPIGVCTPSRVWPIPDLDKGHRGRYIPEAVFSYPDVAVGDDATVLTPMLAGDEIYSSCRWLSDDGLGTVDVTAIVYVIRVGV